MVGWGGGGVDGWVNEVAFCVIIVATNEELELGVGFCVVDDALEFGEGGGVDDWTDEVVKGGWGPDFESLGVGYQCGFEGWVEGGGDVGAGGGATFLALVFKGAADGLKDCIL